MNTTLVHEIETPVTAEKTHYFLEGLALLEGMEKMLEDMNLQAYVFDPLGKLLGMAPLDAMGRFKVPVRLDRPADVELVVGPAGEPETMRSSRAFKKAFEAKDWVADGGRYVLNARLFLQKDKWEILLPIQVGISGHVRTTQGMPIPYLKVEIFDVDREPYAMELRDSRPWLLEQKVLSLQDLLAPSPVEPSQAAGPMVLDWLQNVTLTSKTPPWHLVRTYSTQLLATVMTDRFGGFTATFPWYQLYIRNGRLRFDLKPDILVRVTQVIDGVARILYLDPYASTRWDVTNAHIDLWLDDPAFSHGYEGSSVPAPGMQAFFTRIGNDEVYNIDQINGLYSGPQSNGGPAVSNVAYGSVLELHGNLGKSLTSGAVKLYYRMSYRKGATGEFTAITTPMTDVRVDVNTLVAETFSLGPRNVNGALGLYEVRNLESYYWFNPDSLTEWNTAAVEPKAGLYTLRLELFDENGRPLSNVDYRNGAAKPTFPPTRLPKMEHCDLVMAVQNVAPNVHLGFLNVPENGVLPFSPAQEIKLQIDVSQNQGLIYCWNLYYTKGLNLATTPLYNGIFYDGASAVSVTPPAVTVNDLGITGSNTVGFKLAAWSHIRNGYSNYLYADEQVTGIAFQDCSKYLKEAMAAKMTA